MAVISKENEYKTAEPYRAYAEKTDEKVLLHKYIEDSFKSGNFPIKKNDVSEHILDIGSGNGINSFFLAKLFDHILIEGIEPSEAQYELAVKNNKQENINFKNIGLENFKSDKKYNFILISHVLQYIPISIEDFIERTIKLLDIDSEAWFIQQTKEGINQIIQHQKKYLNNPRFENWITFEDYLPIVQKIVKGQKEFSIKVDYLNSSFENINFKNPTENDKLRLEFILLLNKPYDEQTKEFKDHLAELNLNQDGRIKHPNGILKIRRNA